MTYKTHKKVSIGIGVICSWLLYNTGLIDLNYYLLGIVLVTFSKIGGVYPDVDHFWGNVPDKSIAKRIVNKIIHITKGKHRSWQTHSWDIALLFTIMSYKLPIILNEKGIITPNDKLVTWIICLGFCSGWISHLWSDMFTTSGVRIFCWLPKMFKFVPKKIFSYKFSTDSDWEKFFYKLTDKLNFIISVAYIIYPLKDKIMYLISLVIN